MNMAYELRNGYVHVNEGINNLMDRANSFVKSIFVSDCDVHKFINLQVLEILRNDNLVEAYRFFKANIEQLNAGVAWAGKYLKNVWHFYNPYTNKGLFGKKHALSLAQKYYGQALVCWHSGDINMSMFYLGGTVHLIQDLAVPQHANLKLLGEHKQYEDFVENTYLKMPSFSAKEGGYYHIECIEDAIVKSAKQALEVFLKFKEISNKNKRFYKITKSIFPMAQRTTAGCFLMFYRNIDTIST